MSPEKILEWFNEPDHDQPRLFPRYKWVQEFDLVLIGTCSCGMGHGYFDHTLDKNGRPNRLYFDPKFEDSRPKKVLLVSECCGAYTPEFQKQLKEIYSDIEFVVPNVRNFSEMLDYKELAKDLVYLGFLQDTLRTSLTT